MKRQFCRAAAVLLATALFTTIAVAKETYSAKSYILMDADTGQILCAKSAHKESLIASTTKIMTAYVAIEKCDPNALFTVPAEAVGIEGSSMYLKAGEELPVRELLYGLMLHSGNDAAVALAIAACGSVESFVDAMNRKARGLGLQHTHFENPNGLDGESHFSSAYDLAILTRAALKNPLFRQIVGEKQIRIGSRSFRNHNRLLWMGEGIIGVKTGFTKAAGRILVSAACRKGRTLIAVTICDGNDWQDHLRMYDYGFSLYEERKVIVEDQLLLHVPLADGQVVPLYASEDVTLFASQSDRLSVRLKYPLMAFSPEGIAVADLYVGDLFLKQMQLKWERKDHGTIAENHSIPGNVLPQNGRAMDKGWTGKHQ